MKLTIAQPELPQAGGLDVDLVECPAPRQTANAIAAATMTTASAPAVMTSALLLGAGVPWLLLMMLE